jgi:hypothetical protein
MRKTVMWTAIALSGIAAPPLLAQGLIVSGYANEEFVWERTVPKTHTFDAHNFNLILLGQLRGDVFAAAEIETEHAGEEIALEYGYLAFTRWPYANIVAGKFLVPFGRFNQDLHPGWINRIPGRPLPNDAVFPVDYGDVGVMVRGAAAAGTAGRFTYDVWGVNGLAGDPGVSIRDMRDNREDVDNNIALGARAGFVSTLGFDVGASAYNGVYCDSACSGGADLNLRIFGLDATYHRGPMEVRGEWMQAVQDTASAGDVTKSGFYVQGSYAIMPTVEPAVRFSQVNFPGVTGDTRRISMGFSLYPSDAAALRIFYNINKHFGSGVTDPKDDQFIVQFTVGF